LQINTKIKGILNSPVYQIKITPKKHWFDFDLAGIWQRRNLLFLLIARDIRLRYRQTFLGAVWTLIQTIAPMLVYALVFNYFSKFSNPNIPYTLYVFAGLIIWQFFSSAVNLSGNSFNSHSHTINKVYFPRLILPLANVLSYLVDFVIGCILLLIFIWYSGLHIGWQIILVPFLWLETALLAFAVGTAVASLSVVYRDVRNLLPLTLQLLMFLSPIVYSLEALPEKWRWLIKLNPLTGIVLSFRYAFLGIEAAWFELGVSVLIVIILNIIALIIFVRTERILTDYL
jgi:lipopolysaccharide transport system permease protein